MASLAVVRHSNAVRILTEITFATVDYILVKKTLNVPHGGSHKKQLFKR